MLGMKTYTPEYIDACRARADAGLAGYRTLASPGAEFEASYFNNMVILLDAMFVHRLRTVEGKDGNAMNEVRVLVGSLLEHGGVMTAESSIKLLPAKSVLGIEFGERIVLNEGDFLRLSKAYFDAIEAKFAARQLATAN